MTGDSNGAFIFDTIRYKNIKGSYLHFHLVYITKFVPQMAIEARSIDTDFTGSFDIIKVISSISQKILFLYG